jgi:hypothetical protein
VDERTDHHATRELELRLTGLLYARAILERRGASQEELDALSRETAYVRWRLERCGYDAAA